MANKTEDSIKVILGKLSSWLCLITAMWSRSKTENLMPTWLLEQMSLEFSIGYSDSSIWQSLLCAKWLLRGAPLQAVVCLEKGFWESCKFQILDLTCEVYLISNLLSIFIQIENVSTQRKLPEKKYCILEVHKFNKTIPYLLKIVGLKAYPS